MPGHFIIKHRLMGFCNLFGCVPRCNRSESKKQTGFRNETRFVVKIVNHLDRQRQTLTAYLTCTLICLGLISSALGTRSVSTPLL